MKIADSVSVAATGDSSWNYSNCSSNGISTSNDRSFAVKLFVRTLPQERTGVTIRRKAKFNRLNLCLVPLLGKVLAAELLNTDLLIRGGYLSRAMHPSQSNSVGDDTLLSRPFTVFNRSVPHPSHRVTLSQPCLPVANLGPTKILPHLFLGSQSDAHCEETMAQNGITYVLNVSISSPRPTFIQDGHFLRIPVNDGYSDKLSPFFGEAFQFLDKVREASGCVLIHCLAGVSRSPTLAIAYIMHLLKMTMDEAYRYVKDKRPTISPNFNFLGQLLEYEKQLAAKEFHISDRHLETPFSNESHTDNESKMISSPNDECQPKVKLNFLPAQAGHALTLISPTTALAKLNFNYLSPLKEQPSPSTDELDLSSNSHASQAASVVTVRLGLKHCATKRPLSDRAVDGRAIGENGHEGVDTKRPLVRPSSINFSSAPVVRMKQRTETPSSVCSHVEDVVNGRKTLFSPLVIEQKYSSCTRKFSSSNDEANVPDFEESRRHTKDKTWFPADHKWISENNDVCQHKAITEQPNKGIGMGVVSTTRPNKLSLPSWNLLSERTNRPNTAVALKSDVTKDCASLKPQTNASSQPCDVMSDLNKFVAAATKRPGDLAITLDCRFDCDDQPHSAMARKSRSLEDILSCPSPYEMKTSSEQGILSNCSKHSSYRLNVLASPVSFGLDKHLLRCQAMNSDSFQSPSSNESPEMIPVS